MRKITVFPYLNPDDFEIKIALVIEDENDEIIFTHNEYYTDEKLSAGLEKYVNNVLRKSSMSEMTAEEREKLSKPNESKFRYYLNKFFEKEK